MQNSNGKPPTPPGVPNPNRVWAISAFAAQANAMAALGLPADEVINALLDVTAAVISGIEPEAMRQKLMTDIRLNLPKIIEAHWSARHQGLVRAQA